MTLTWVKEFMTAPKVCRLMESTAYGSIHRDPVGGFGVGLIVGEPTGASGQIVFDGSRRQ